MMGSIREYAIFLIYCQAITFITLTTGAMVYGLFLLWKKNTRISKWFFDYIKHRKRFKKYLVENELLIKKLDSDMEKIHNACVKSKTVESEVLNVKP